MKKTILITLGGLMAISMTASAQSYRGEYSSYNPEQVARQQTDMMARELSLTPHQYDRIYRHNLKEARRGNASRSGIRNNRMSRRNDYRYDGYDYRQPNRMGFNNRSYRNEVPEQYDSRTYRNRSDRNYGTEVYRPDYQLSEGSTVYSTPNGNRVTKMDHNTTGSNARRKADRQAYNYYYENNKYDDGYDRNYRNYCNHDNYYNQPFTRQSYRSQTGSGSVRQSVNSRNYDEYQPYGYDQREQYGTRRSEARDAETRYNYSDNPRYRYDDRNSNTNGSNNHYYYNNQYPSAPARSTYYPNNARSSYMPTNADPTKSQPTSYKHDKKMRQVMTPSQYNRWRQGQYSY